jgi:hypothetical protein
MSGNTAAAAKSFDLGESKWFKQRFVYGSRSG